MAKTLSISLGKYRARLSISRRAENVAAPAPAGDPIALGYAKALERRFPELGNFGLAVTEENATDVIAFYADYLPLVYEPARSAFVRNLLHRLRERSPDPRIRTAATRGIAISDLSDGMPDRALALKNDPELAKRWDEQVSQLETAYGAALVREDWSQADRGKCLIAYFDAHREFLHGKDILHLAPESNLRAWFNANRAAMQIGQYRTADAYGTDVDENHDITAIKIADGSYDVVICHRVMEHVLSDENGFSELYRVLRPGGLLSFSVPQAAHRPRTAEWAIPDETHHGHVRQYGADLADRMESAGFRVEVEPWLTRLPPETLRGMGAFPMRMFHAWRRP